MKTPPVPANEAERLAALRSYDVLDSDPEPQFDALVKLAAHIAGVPIALITLIDADRQWFKARYGMAGAQSPRSVSFCGHAVGAGVPLVVDDALEDERFSDNPAVVGKPHVRFYAGMPLRTEEGFVLGTLCAIDTQPRHMTDEQLAMLDLLAHQAVALLEARRRHSSLHAFRKTLDHVPDAITVVDVDAMRYEYVNDSAARQSGYTRAELMGRNPVDILPDSVRDKLRKSVAARLTPGELVTTFETVFRARDGTELPVEVVLQLIPGDGTRGRVVCITRDISERKRMERLQSEFVSTVSHELRTPLTSIRGSLGLVAGGVTGVLPTEAREYVDIALANSDRLVRLINDILDVEKMQSGKLEFRLQSLPLPKLLAQVLTANAHTALAYGTRIVTTTEMPDVEVTVDPDRFTQVLTNLLSNAAKFSPSESPIEVEAVAHGDTVRISVRDHGAGIPLAFRERVFQRFAQAEMSSTRQQGGTGLGLNISKTIIDRLGGSLRFEDAEGGGTRFTIELPALPPVTATPPNGARILVCEDDPHVYRLIEHTLRSGGFALDIATTLERARRLLAVNGYDAVTLDLMLADSESSELVAELARHNVPMVVVSGSNRDLGRAAVFVADVIAKPFRVERLLDAITRVVAAAQATRPRILHVEDDADLRQIVQRMLPPDWDVSGAESMLQARKLLAEHTYDAVVIDLGLPDGSGAELISQAGEARVIIFSAKQVSSELSRRVTSALVKTRSTPEDLRAVLTSFVGARAP